MKNKTLKIIFLLTCLITIFCSQVRSQYCGKGKSRVCVIEKFCTNIDEDETEIPVEVPIGTGGGTGGTGGDTGGTGGGTGGTGGGTGGTGGGTGGTGGGTGGTGGDTGGTGGGTGGTGGGTGGTGGGTGGTGGDNSGTGGVTDNNSNNRNINTTKKPSVIETTDAIDADDYNYDDILIERAGECAGNEVCCPTKNVLCGIRNYDPIGPKIMGDFAEFGEFPWMIFISTKTSPIKYIGGGSLIHPTVVMTVAHKIEKYTINNIIVRGGEYDYSSTNEAKRHKDVEVEKIIIHENYRKAGLLNDIALLILKEPMPIDDHINPICLPSQNFNFDNADCVVTGWGAEKLVKGKNSKVLKKIDLPIVGKEKCEELIKTEKSISRFRLHKSFICAGGEEGKDACTGDGGSPLVCEIPEKDGEYHQAGIVSWGVDCGKQNVPGVYVDVSKFTDWIQSKLNKM